MANKAGGQDFAGMRSVTLAKAIPVVCETDVLIAGGGIAGCMAAVTAARNGARVTLIERFGTLGGNMGPGMFSGGVVHLALVNPDAMAGGLKGIVGEFLGRCGAYAGGQLGHDYFYDSQVVSYVWLKMMEENNVALMLNACVSGPILDGGRVTGLIVETKSGSQAVMAKVTIDATGDADVAFLAGCPMDDGHVYFHPGCYFAIGGVDETRYLDFLKNAPPPDPADLEWGRKTFLDNGMPWYVASLNPMLPFLKKAWNEGEYRIVGRVAGRAAISVDHGFYTPKRGIVGAQVGLWGSGMDCGDAALRTELEVGSRKWIFETAQFLRRLIPGFEQARLHVIAPYFHNRGGRSPICDYTLTKEDVRTGARFDDAIFHTWGDEVKEGEFTMEGFDFPYRQLLPQQAEGLLMAGRSAIIQPPVNRTRYKVMLMGQAAGLAAALAARDGVSPRQIDVQELRRILVTRYQVPSA
ncbi:MAG: FAD-dependent oxidoreductase [Kiritimatiellia bacterium]